jgi:serine protease
MVNVFRPALVLLAVSAFIAGCSDSSTGNQPDLSGTIVIETNTRIDQDTADEIRLGGLLADNNEPGNAQPLPANATVGGYLSANSGSYAGVASDFSYFEDRIDFYAANLIAGDRISLQVFSSPSRILALHDEPPFRQVRVLKSDASGLIEVVTPVAGSADLDPIIFTLPDGFESGFYLIEVSTGTSGKGMPFRYVLSLADLTTTTGFNARYSEPSFVLDQAIVQMEARTGSRAMVASMSATMGVTAQKHLGRDAWLMQRGSSGMRMLSGLAGQDAQKATLDWVHSLGQQPGVTLAEPNYVYTAQVSPDDDDFYNRQWALPFMQTPLAWQVAQKAGEGVGIAILDTGVFRSPPTRTGDWHPDLNANIRLITNEIMDYVSGSLDIDGETLAGTNGRDLNPADPGDGKAQSSNFHGTHVAGIAAAVDNTIGVVGVAPKALIYPVRVLGRDGVGSSADLIAAINWAASRPEIDVINLSLGGLGDSSTLKRAIDLAWNQGEGQLIVAAAGNAATDEATFPAAYDNVVGVGAVDAAGVLAGYSNIGPSVDLVAPGGDASRDANQDGFADVIVSTWGTDEEGNFVPGFAALQGTSMAAPHVAGVFALMKGEVGDLMTPARFISLLKAGSLTRPVGPAFEYGAGLIDALAAMDATLEGSFPVTLTSLPTAVQLNAAVLSTELLLTAFPEGEEFTVSGASSSAGWLSATVEQPDSPSSSATVTVTADATGLDPQQRYATELVIAYDPVNDTARTLTVPVSLKLESTPDEKDAGRHYVLLISAEGGNEGEAVQQKVVSASNGRYEYAFNEVEPGEYFLVAGTDTDNNGFICENGEACAEYPVNGLPESISLGETPQAGAVLNTSFRRPTISALGLPRVGFEGYRIKHETVRKGSSEPFREYVR